MLIENTFLDNSQDGDVFSCKPPLMLLETALGYFSKAQLGRVYDALFAGKVTNLATSKMTTFAVQKLLNNLDEAQFDAAFEELDFARLFMSGHFGVVNALATNAKRLSTKQGQFMNVGAVAADTNR